MAKLKALLIGVDDYTHLRPTQVRAVRSVGPTPLSMPPKTVMVDADLPSARRDVKTMAHLLDKAAPALGYDRVEGVVLSGAADTTQASIRNWLAWLAKSASKGDQLLLYFSGHSAWVRQVDLHAVRLGERVGVATPSRGAARDAVRFSGRRGRPRLERGEAVALEVALCPSDTTWDDVFITSLDVQHFLYHAFKAEAWLEIILETCSAGGIARQYRGLPRKYFGEDSLDPEVYARWDAAELDQSSHSAPVPLCKGDVQGLFTHFLCKELESPNAAKRGEVINKVDAALKQYWVDRKNRCKCSEPAGAFPQTPHLHGDWGPSPFGGSSATGGQSGQPMSWIYP